MDSLLAIFFAQVVLWIGVFVVIVRLVQRNNSLRKEVEYMRKSLEGGQEEQKD